MSIKKKSRSGRSKATATTVDGTFFSSLTDDTPSATSATSARKERMKTNRNVALSKFHMESNGTKENHTLSLWIQHI